MLKMVQYNITELLMYEQNRRNIFRQSSLTSLNDIIENL